MIMKLNMSRKENQIMVDFIEIYKSEICLWKVKCEEYRNRTLKDVAYDKLCNKLQELEPGATRKSVVAKINSLRSALRKERKKVKESKKSELLTDCIYKPNLWYYDLFDFLPDQENVTRTSNFNQESEDKFYPLEDEILNDENNGRTNSTSHQMPSVQLDTSIFSRPPKRKFKKDDLNTEALSAMLDHFKKPNEIPDCYDLFGKTVAYKLRGMDKHVALLTEKKINDILFEAEISQLQSTSDCFTMSSQAIIKTED